MVRGFCPVIKFGDFAVRRRWRHRSGRRFAGQKEAIVRKENKTMKHPRTALTVLFCVAGIAGYGQTNGTQPDNTKVNERDRNAGEATADQQKVNATDRDLTTKIRQSVMADKSLSTDAHNIKIISQNGAVTLKGPVKSEAEKKSLIAKAVAVAGSADKVTDQISVKQ
jgi:hyperosmotically inducible protein